ncbi:hypothetical protein LTR64_001690 [Lithohypha guttulata]|uniref:uncharacterized protein n=1 Tax=Lithohypha guttulata TaxID=1690604 RepID=UPI002DDF5921|nr:hypothetical protein LTR51_003884 [Lithohypha guttulata]
MPPVQTTNLQSLDPAQTTKHRRTRSGCFTCRSRRVKCDETRPVCDRCRKGNRECEFPQSASSAKRTKNEPKSTTSETASEKLETIKDESETETDEDEEEEDPSASATSKVNQRKLESAQGRGQSRNNPSRSQRQRQQSNASARTYEQPGTPSTDTSAHEAPLSPALQCPSPLRKWRQIKPDLKPEIETYLRFQHDYMTFCHYLFKIDPEDFVHKELIDLALQFEPLLYAVVAFAAYHFAVRLPEPQADFNSFWKYYCKSIVTLRKHLETTGSRDDLVLLTVLQLATFEEYMGDWTNLATHHRAANGILTSNYTPQTIMKTDRSRKIFDWYIRMDVIAGLMAMRDISLDRSWLDHAMKWHDERCIEEDDDNTDNKLIYFSKGMEVMGYDIAHTFTQANELLEKGISTIDTVLNQANELYVRLDKMRRRIQQLNDPAFSGIEPNTPRDEDDAFDPNIPLFRDALWPLNYIWLDWYGILIMLKQQTLLAILKAQRLQAELRLEVKTNENLQRQAARIPAELMQYSKIQCQIYNAIRSSPSAPAGATLICYASLGLSAVFLPRAPPSENSKYTMWARRQLANIEKQGYVWPPHFRKEMAHIWQDPEIEDWWLPKGEGNTRIISEIRAVVQDRVAAAMSSPNNDGRNDLREIKGLFEKMDINRERRGSATVLDPNYVNSAAGMAHAASLVSTPEDGGSSAGSVTGFSPRSIDTENENSKYRRRRKSTRSNDTNDTPSTQSTSLASNRMSGIWEEQPRAGG